MSDKRHFTVVEGKKEHGLFVGRTPSSVAKKVVSKLSKGGNKVVFELRETTQGSKKKVYGPYEGMKKKLKEPRKVGDRVYKYESIVKKIEKKGGKSLVRIKINPKHHALSDHGYTHVENMPVEKRHDILKKVLAYLQEKYGEKEGFRKLIDQMNAASVLLKSSNPKESKIFAIDRDWISGLYKKFKGGQGNEGLYEENTFRFSFQPSSRNSPLVYMVDKVSKKESNNDRARFRIIPITRSGMNAGPIPVVLEDFVETLTKHMNDYGYLSDRGDKRELLLSIQRGIPKAKTFGDKWAKFREVIKKEITKNSNNRNNRN